MIKFIELIKSMAYRLLRSRAYSSFNCCSKCKKNRKNYWDTFNFKSDHLIGYDKILAEWILFQDNNLYVKIWLMNGYVVDVYPLTEKIWNTISTFCSRCIKKHFVSLKQKP